MIYVHTHQITYYSCILDDYKILCITSYSKHASYFFQLFFTLSCIVTIFFNSIYSHQNPPTILTKTLHFNSKRTKTLLPPKTFTMAIPTYNVASTQALASNDHSWLNIKLILPSWMGVVWVLTRAWKSVAFAVSLWSQRQSTHNW